MRSTVSALAVALLVFGCSKDKSEPADKPVEKPATKPATAPPPEAPKPESVVVHVKQGDGELATLLAGHAARAKQAGLVPYVEFTADWCKPCVAFKKYLDDPLMKDALKGSYIVMADFDAYGAAASDMGVMGIPTWLELDDAGVPTGRRIVSDVWGEDIPANMAPPLKAFFSPGE
jgi:thiol:disulfide interchange protein